MNKGSLFWQKTFSIAAWDGKIKVEQGGLTKLRKKTGVHRGCVGLKVRGLVPDGEKEVWKLARGSP